MMRDRRQEIFLKEMGYTLWQLRESGTSAHAEEEAVHRPCDSIEEPAKKIETPRKMPEVPAAVLELAPEPSLFTDHLPKSLKEPNVQPDGRAQAIACMGWDDLTRAIQECRACELCRHRKQAVPGVGDQSAEWLFIGEGPGSEEDVRGEPFVGQAGRLLDAMLFAIGLKRSENVYIANTVKCRPEGNRTPLPAEMAVCRPFLMRQIALVRPAVIVLLGKAAAHSVLGDDASLASLRKKPHWFGGCPVVVTYHPAYLLRNLPEKAKAWEDLCLARQQWAGIKYQ
jgi:DNA polymerase